MRPARPSREPALASVGLRSSPCHPPLRDPPATRDRRLGRPVWRPACPVAAGRHPRTDLTRMSTENTSMNPTASVLQRARQATVAFVVQPVPTQSSAPPDTLHPRIIGSGVALAENPRIILTARHVIAGGQGDAAARLVDTGRPHRVAILSPGGFTPVMAGEQQIGGSFGYHVTDEDFGYLTTPERDIAIVTIPLGSPAPTVGMSTADPSHVKEGSNVATCGWPYGTEIQKATNEPPLSSFRWGRISMISPHPGMSPEGRNLYYTQMPVDPGNSGGGVFSPQTGKLIGVVSAKLVIRGMDTGLSVVVPLTHAAPVIHQVLEQEKSS